MGVNDDDQDLEAVDTISLTDFPITDDGDSGFQDHHHHHRRSTPSEDFFEFFNGGLGHYSKEHRMSHAEDIIFAGKLIPINDQPQHEQPPPTQNQTRKQKQVHRRRSESMRELKSTTSNNPTVTRLVRNSHSLDYKKLNRNSRFNYESTAEIHRNSLGNKTSSSSRWSDLMFGPVKVPTEMDLRDIRNRQIVQSTSKSLFPTVDGGDGFTVNRIADHRKTSWGVLGILSCKSSGSVAVTMP